MAGELEVLLLQVELSALVAGRFIEVKANAKRLPL